MAPSAVVERAVDVAVVDHYPLTPTQTGLLYHCLLEGRSGAGVQQLVFTLEEDAGLDAFRDAWRRAIDRHPVLRTRFHWDGLDAPEQEVAARVELPWTERAGDLETYLREDRERGIELDRAPLMRFAAFPGRRVVWTFSQALLDGVSAVRLLQEVAGSERREAPEFRDYVTWLLGRDSAEEYWREALRGFSAPTPLPYSRAAGTGWGELDIHLATAPSPTMVLAAWALLLGRTSGESDVLFGVAKSRRPAGFADAIGMFVNTVPLRVRIEPELPAPAYLAGLQAQLDALEPHAHTPLVHIQKWSGVAHGLFETLVTFETDVPRDAGAFRDVRLHERTSYPLTVTVFTGTIRLSYDRRRIDDDAARCTAGHLTTLLESLTGAGPLKALPMLTAAERRQILIEWNDTARDYPLGQGVHRLFEAQAAKTPGRIAVRFEGSALTYAELDERATHIAHHLRSLGVGPDRLTAILVDRSPDMIAALLGILKAGGAYVPLDPMYPVERLAYMLEDSGAPVLVTQNSLAALIPGHRAQVVLLDVELPVARGPLPVAAPENLAYVIYTSGSTGKPKGVQIPHRALVNFLHSMREEPGLTSDDALLALTTLSFDIAGLELWLPLMTGASIELVSRETAADGRRLLEELGRSGATVMQATPATWRMLLEAGWKGDAKLKILCGGEALPADLAAALAARCGSLWNVYGPTETTVWSAAHRVDVIEGTNISIGRPIANTTIYTLDAQLEPVPVGVAGELHIGGTGLARGYLNRPELTAERFIDWNGERLYRTGDAARFLPDGRIEYLNRLDNQVKLRGYRIELGEIEAALRRHPGVQDAVVILRSEAAKVLVAYVIGTAGAAELREFLGRSLPEYMVPSFFVPLDAFPLTPNGKVDRKALPAPDRAAPESEAAFVAPRDALETQLAKIWSEVLGVPSVGVKDDFFTLGGESILALRMFVKIEEAFGQKLPLATLLEASTIEALANELRGAAAPVQWAQLVPMRTTGAKPPFFCVSGVGGNIINYRPLVQRLGPDQPFYALQPVGLDGSEPLTKMEEIAASHLEEIRRIQPEGPYFLGGLSFGGVVAFEMARQLLDAGQETALVALFDSMPVGYGRLAAHHATDAVTQSNLVRRMRVHLKILWQGPDRVAYLAKKIQRLRGTLAHRAWETACNLCHRAGRRLPRSLCNVESANYMALRHYRPRAYPDSVVFFYAEREPEAFTREKLYGWGLLATGGVVSEHVPGHHQTILQEPHVGVLAAKLAAHLDQTRRTPPIGAEVPPPRRMSRAAAVQETA